MSGLSCRRALSLIFCSDIVKIEYTKNEVNFHGSYEWWDALGKLPRFCNNVITIISRGWKKRKNRVTAYFVEELFDYIGTHSKLYCYPPHTILGVSTQDCQVDLRCDPMTVRLVEVMVPRWKVKCHVITSTTHVTCSLNANFKLANVRWTASEKYRAFAVLGSLLQGYVFDGSEGAQLSRLTEQKLSTSVVLKAMWPAI